MDYGFWTEVFIPTHFYHYFLSLAHVELTFDQYEVFYQWFRKRKYLKKSALEDILKSLEGMYSEMSLKEIMEMENISEEELSKEMDIETQILLDEMIEQNNMEHLIILFKAALSFSCLFISSMRITINSYI